MAVRQGPRQGSARPWAFLGIAAACAMAFVAIVAWLFDDAGRVQPGAFALDDEITQAFVEMRTPSMTGRVGEVSAMGSAPVLIMLALLVCALILRARDRLGFIHLGVMLAGSGFLSRWLQSLWDRPRPEDLLSFIVVTKGSFPSAHVFGATACYVTFAFLCARYAAGWATEIASYAAAFLIVALVGVTRVYLGAHHTTDVLAGMAGGAAWAFLVAAVFSIWYRPLQRPGGRAG